MGPVIAAGVALLAMVAISLWGAKVLPPGARIPVHHGIGGYGNWQPKSFGLITYPAVGAVLFGITFANLSSAKPTATIIAPIAMIVIAWSQYRAIQVAIRQSGRN